MPAAKKPAAKLLSIDDILTVDDLPTARVSCPEWGGDVEVRALSRAQVVDAVHASTDEDGTMDNGKYQMAVIILGMGLTEDRVRQLDGKHAAPLKRIATKVREISGIGDASWASGVGADAGFPDS